MPRGPWFTSEIDGVLSTQHPTRVFQKDDARCKFRLILARKFMWCMFVQATSLKIKIKQEPRHSETELDDRK
jgi:hypothetical protein